MSQLKYICIHWTAGGLKANAIDRRCYHFIVQDDGSIVAGVHKPEANAKRLSNRDRYAQHCGGGNSFAIGIALAGGGKGHRHGEITRVSFEALCRKVAEECVKRGIPITPKTVYTHYEFGKRHPRTDSAGKPDISNLPFEPNLKADEIGDYIRSKIVWYRERL